MKQLYTRKGQFCFVAYIVQKSIIIHIRTYWYIYIYACVCAYIHYSSLLHRTPLSYTLKKLECNYIYTFLYIYIYIYIYFIHFFICIPSILASIVNLHSPGSNSRAIRRSTSERDTEWVKRNEDKTAADAYACNDLVAFGFFSFLFFLFRSNIVVVSIHSVFLLKLNHNIHAFFFLLLCFIIIIIIILLCSIDNVIISAWLLLKVSDLWYIDAIVQENAYMHIYKYIYWWRTLPSIILNNNKAADEQQSFFVRHFGASRS